MKVYIIGIGLIGGSMALDLKEKITEATFLGIDTNEKHLEEAKKIGIIQEKAGLNDLNSADFVIVSVPVDVGVTLLPQILDTINDDALVIDVGSTKYPVCTSVENHAKRRNFLATHPIAGTEFSGQKQLSEVCFMAKQI